MKLRLDNATKVTVIQSILKYYLNDVNNLFRLNNIQCDMANFFTFEISCRTFATSFHCHVLRMNKPFYFLVFLHFKERHY